MRKIKVSPYLPNETAVEEISANHAKISAYPFESGYAVTMAHPIRRLLLGSSIGYAPIALKIEGVSHEFDTLSGMYEDVAVFIMNLKNIRFKIIDGADSAKVQYSFKGQMDIKASDLNNDLVETVNPDAHLATINSDAEINFSIEIRRGIGYVPSEDILDGIEEGYIALDAFFTPVRNANYAIEPVLVDGNPDYEKIVFDIETDGQITPLEAFGNALEMMQGQLAVFNTAFDVKVEAKAKGKDSGNSKLKPFLATIDSLGLGARSFNALEKADIKYLGDLVLLGRDEIKAIKNLGQKSVDEIMAKLDEEGFSDDYVLDAKLRDELVAKLEQLKAK